MIGITTKIFQDTRFKTKSGNYAVKLRITYQREQKSYPTGKRLTIEEWKKTQDPNCRGENKKLRLLFAAIEKKAITIIDEMEIFSFSQFEKKFNGKAPNRKELDVLFKEYIDKLKKEDRLSTASSISTSLSGFNKYKTHLKKRKIYLRDINEEWLKGYEKYQLDKGRSPSTVGIHMRNLRIILNIAIENGDFPKENYPFGKRKYKIPATRNVKKALTIKDIKKLVEYTSKDKTELWARDLWLFSYLANGINTKDICLLKYRNVNEKNITFVRAKTQNSTRTDSKPIIVPINEKLQEIIDKRGNPNIEPENYVFDVLTDEDTQADIDRKTRQFTKTINIRTKRIGETLKLDLKLTTYVARHSYATILKRSGAPIAFISESLGHKDLHTTENYLDSFEDETKRKYQNNLLDF